MVPSGRSRTGSPSSSSWTRNPARASRSSSGSAPSIPWSRADAAAWCSSRTRRSRPPSAGRSRSSSPTGPRATSSPCGSMAPPRRVGVARAAGTTRASVTQSPARRRVRRHRTVMRPMCAVRLGFGAAVGQTAVVDGGRRPTGEDVDLHLQADRLLEGISDAFVALSPDWIYLYVNSQAGELFGRDPADLVGKHIWREFPEGVGQPFHRAYERAMSERRPVFLEDYMAPWDRWFENRIHPLPGGGIGIFFHEITERKRAEIALEQERQAHLDSLALLDTLIAAAPVGLAFVDRDLRYREMNDELARMNGRTVAEHLGRTVSE